MPSNTVTSTITSLGSQEPDAALFNNNVAAPASTPTISKMKSSSRNQPNFLRETISKMQTQSSPLIVKAQQLVEGLRDADPMSISAKEWQNGLEAFANQTKSEIAVDSTQSLEASVSAAPKVPAFK